jgi:hypothetical protein
LVFILKRKLFQDSFGNVFEVLEKEKEKEVFSFSASGRKSASLLFLGPVVFFSRALFSLGCGPRRGPAQLAAAASRRALLPLRPTDHLGPLVSGIFFLLPLVFESDTLKESDAAPFPPWLAPHVEPLLNSSRGRTAPPQP